MRKSGGFRNFRSLQPLANLPERLNPTGTTAPKTGSAFQSLQS
jgi:hypothetical protein